MEKEELLALQGEKELYRTMMSQISGRIKEIKKELKELLEVWEVANNKYMIADRKIALATKVRVIKGGKKKEITREITSEMAAEFLAAIGETVEFIEDEEELVEEDYEPESCI